MAVGRLKLLWVVALTFLCSVGVSISLADDIRIRRDQEFALLAPSPVDSELELAIDDLKSYLFQSLGLKARSYPAKTELIRIQEPVCVSIEVKASSGVGDNLGLEGSRVVCKRDGDKLVISLTGATSKGASYAIYSFLEKEVGLGFFIDGDYVPRLELLQLGSVDRIEKPAVPIRALFFHHVWKHPHAHCWRLWDFDGWRTAIDWMRRKRFNTMPLFHDSGEYMWGDVLLNAFPKIPRNESTLANYVVDPTWRTALNKRIFAYVRKSGLKVAYNLFYSQVPAYFKDSFPELRYHELNMSNLGIDADQPECKLVMKKYWGELLTTYGIDDSHIYLVCSYRHERTLGEGFKNKNKTTEDAISVIKELDPQAKIYLETWCWKYRDEKVKTWETLDANPGLEWLDFDREIPKEIGVIEWDVRRMHSRNMPSGFNGRPYIQLVHTNMEGWWPPSTIRNHPQWIIDYMNYAIDRGAHGLMYFHIQANTNEILADLGAEIGMVGRPDLKQYYQDYARRRFGADSSAVLAESLKALCDAVDFGQNRENSPYRMFLALAPPGFFNSAEDLLAKCTEETREGRKRWINDRLEVIRAKKVLFGEALTLARSVAPRRQTEKFFQQYLWELDYVASRFEGIENLYLSHYLADSDPRQSELHFERAIDAFLTFKELFRNRPGIRMNELKQLEPNVPFTASFLKDWETRGYWEGSPQTATFMHVVWERFDQYESVMRKLRPKELSK